MGYVVNAMRRQVSAAERNARNCQIEARNISASFGKGSNRVQALEEVSLEAAAGEFVSIIGPSGCGKSTLLRIVCGLQSPDSGNVAFGGVDATGRTGRAGYMPQRDLLMPWKSVIDNVALALELQGIGRREARERALAHFPRFGLEGFSRKYPRALSGGMRQRAALLRTFLTGRQVLLLDEPFGSLDALTRAGMQEWIADIWDSLGKTILLVTHDVEEAIYLSDRIYLLTPRPGRVATVVDVRIPRPRNYDKTLSSPQFARLRGELLAVLRQELPYGS
jgi:ABC-type nitrate/sulfonate/bicarbonate transport system ATPase subunit